MDTDDVRSTVEQSPDIGETLPLRLVTTGDTAPCDSSGDVGYHSMHHADEPVGDGWTNGKGDVCVKSVVVETIENGEYEDIDDCDYEEFDKSKDRTKSARKRKEEQFGLKVNSNFPVFKV